MSFDMNAGFRRLVSFRTPLWKGILFGGAWYFFPAWLFIPVAICLYFIPFFQSTKFLPVFVAVIGIYVFASEPYAYALVGGILFGWLIAIRELLFIDRRSAYEVLILAVSFFLFRIFYHAHLIVEASSFLTTFLLAGLMAWMAKGYVDCFTDETTMKQKKPFAAIGIGLFWFLVWQTTIIVSLIPADFVYQSLLAFLCVVGMFDILSAYFLGNITREKILLTAIVMFCGLVLLLSAAPLGL